MALLTRTDCPSTPSPHAHTQKQRVPEKRLRRRQRGEGKGHCELSTLTYFWKLVCNSINDNYNNKLLHNQHRRCHLPVES